MFSRRVLLLPRALVDACVLQLATAQWHFLSEPKRNDETIPVTERKDRFYAM